METNLSELKGVLCCWLGTDMSGVEDPAKELKQFFREAFDVEATYLESVVTGPDNRGPGGRIDVLFLVADADIPKFAIKRLMTDDIKWFGNMISNRPYIYPQSILDKYKNFY